MKEVRHASVARIVTEVCRSPEQGDMLRQSLVRRLAGLRPPFLRMNKKDQPCKSTCRRGMAI